MTKHLLLPNNLQVLLLYPLIFPVHKLKLNIMGNNFFCIFFVNFSGIYLIQFLTLIKGYVVRVIVQGMYRGYLVGEAV